MSTATKICKKCDKELPMDSFYTHIKMSDGYLNKCRECVKDAAKNNREKNIAYYREYDRKRGNRQSKEYPKEYRKKYPNKYLATNKVNNALRDGRIEKGEMCELCGTDERLHAHHDDYLKPLDVRWLCAACHRQWHVENGEAKNAS